MITKELVDFIKKSKNEGKSNEQIKAVLMQNSWLSTDVEEGFLAANPPAPLSVPIPPPTYSAPLFVPPILNVIPNNPQASVGSILGSMNINRPTVLNTIPKKSHKGLIIFIIIILLLVAGGVSAYFFRDNLKTLPLIKKFFPAVEVAVEVPAVPSPVIVPAEMPVLPPPAPNCDGNMDCLIAAASTCQPISATISSTGPNPLIQGFDQMSKTKYEIKNSTNPNSCILVYSLLSSSVSISDANRKLALSEGLTSAQIDAQLKSMNSSFVDFTSQFGNPPTTCVSTKATIVSYLTDAKNHFSAGDGGVQISMGTNSSGTGSTNTITNTTSTGQKLVCTQ